MSYVDRTGDRIQGYRLGHQITHSLSLSVLLSSVVLYSSLPHSVVDKMVPSSPSPHLLALWQKQRSIPTSFRFENAHLGRTSVACWVSCLLQPYLPGLHASCGTEAVQRLGKREDDRQTRRMDVHCTVSLRNNLEEMSERRLKGGKAHPKADPTGMCSKPRTVPAPHRERRRARVGGWGPGGSSQTLSCRDTS